MAIGRKRRAKREDESAYHCLALGAGSLNGELVWDGDYKVIGGAIPGRVRIHDLDGHVEDHV